MASPLAIAAGAGPGLGQSLVASFGQSGYKAFGLNRTIPTGAANTLAVDLADQAQTAPLLRNLIGTHGAPKLVVHNTGKLHIAPFTDTDPADFEAVWRAMVLSAVHLAQGVLPAMAAAEGGTFIVSGATASLRGGKGFAAFASAKAALRVLTQSLAREYGPKGIHVAHVILDGIVDTQASRELHRMDTDRMMQPNDIAQTYLAIARQPKSTWTHELDLRPMGEAF
jgi:NAD(P)-dependent dehydrogenase (short-subunit alcohol dehydrogenase family)